MSWTKECMFEFMRVHAPFFGKDVLQIEGASDDWICERFTKKLFEKMIKIDFYQVCRGGYARIITEGKGEIQSVNLVEGVVLPMEKCVEIANFIAGRTNKLTELDVFAIIKNLKYGLPLKTDYMSILERAVCEVLKCE